MASDTPTHYVKLKFLTITDTSFNHKFHIKMFSEYNSDETRFQVKNSQPAKRSFEIFL